MKIAVRNGYEMRMQRGHLMNRILRSGYSLPHVARFAEEFSKALKPPDDKSAVVEMHVFTVSTEVDPEQVDSPELKAELSSAWRCRTARVDISRKGYHIIRATRQACPSRRLNSSAST